MIHWFLNVSRYQGHPPGWLKHRLLGLFPGHSEAVSVGQGPRMSVPNPFPGAAAAAGPDPLLYAQSCVLPQAGCCWGSPRAGVGDLELKGTAREAIRVGVEFLMGPLWLSRKRAQTAGQCSLKTRPKK